MAEPLPLNLAAADVVKYPTRVGAKNASPETAAGFGAEVDRVLRDPRGWRKYGYTFVRDEAAPDITIRLEDSADADELCGASGFSCWRPARGDIVMHLGNWMGGSRSSLPLERYRNYVVCHEVGHALGLEHQRCPAAECARRGLATCPSSVMMQVTRGPGHVAPCVESDWPLDPDWGIDNPRLLVRARRMTNAILSVIVFLILVLVAIIATVVAFPGTKVGFVGGARSLGAGFT